MIKMDFKFPDLAGKLDKYADEIYLFMAAQMQTNRAELFDAEGAHNGHKKWAALKFRNGRILQDRGTLRKSIGPSNDGIQPRSSEGGFYKINGELITIGTSLGYARLMNDGTKKMPGGVLRATNAKALRIPLPSGKSATEASKSLSKGASKARPEDVASGAKKNQKYIFRKSVKIEPREFDTWTEGDENEMSEALMNKLSEVLSRG